MSFPFPTTMVYTFAVTGPVATVNKPADPRDVGSSHRNCTLAAKEARARLVQHGLCEDKYCIPLKETEIAAAKKGNGAWTADTAAAAASVFFNAPGVVEVR